MNEPDASPTPPSPPAAIDYTMPPPGDRFAHRRAEPRPLAALWIAYLAGVGILCLGSVGLGGLMSHDLYRPAARAGLVLAGLGVGVLWPMVRLCQEFPAHPRRAALADLSVILPPLHAFIWPQMFGWMAAWPPRVVAGIALTLSAWGVVIAALLSVCQARGRAMELGGRAAPRALWMLGFLGVSIVGPSLAAWRLPADSSVSLALLLSPGTAALELAADRSWTGSAAKMLPEHWQALWGVALAGLVLWLVGAGLARERKVA